MDTCRKSDIASVLKTAETHNQSMTGVIHLPATAETTVITTTIPSTGMTLNEYQNLAQVTVVYRDELKVIYPTIGLCGEAGEVAEKVKKWLRDDGGVSEMSLERKELLKKELGDVLWYLAALARDLGLTLDEIAKHNIEKLHDRKERGVVHGKGDVR